MNTEANVDKNKLIKLDIFSRVAVIVLIIITVIPRIFFRDVDWLIWVLLPVVFLWLAIFYGVQIYINKKTKGIEKQIIVEAAEEINEKRETEATQKRERIIAMKKSKGKIPTYKVEKPFDLGALLKDFTKANIDEEGQLFYKTENTIEDGYNVVSIQVFYKPHIIRGISFNHKTEAEVLELFDDMLMSYFDEQGIIKEGDAVIIICAIIIQHEIMDEAKKDFYYSFKGYKPSWQRHYNLCAVDMYDANVYYYKPLSSDTGDEVNLHKFLLENLCLTESLDKEKK